jgi:hypothetical protein
VLVLVLVPVLAGCRVDVAVTTTMQADGSGQVAVAVTCDADVVTQRPEVLSELKFDDARAAGWTVTAPTRTPDGGATVSLSKPFRTPAEGTRVLAEISGPQGPLRALRLGQVRSFARVQSSFDGSAGLTGGVAAFSDSALTQLVGATPLSDLVTDQQVADGFHVQVTTRLPGRVTSTNGNTGAAGITWSPPLASASTMHAAAVVVDQGARDARRNQRLLLAGAGVWVILVLAGAGTWWWWRHRRRPPTTASPVEPG